MTFVGKILVVAILIMSIGFMFLSVSVYTTHRNWKVATSTLNGTLQAAQNKSRQLTQDVEAAQKSLALEKAARRASLAVLENRNQTYQKELTTRVDQYDKLQADHGEAIQTIENAEDNMRRLKDEVDKLRDEIRVAQEDRDSQFSKVQQLTDELGQGEGELRRLKARSQGLTAQIGRLQLVADVNGLDPNAPIDGAAPNVDGVVTAVRNKNLIEVSIGSDDGLRKGHTLEVYRRSGSYVGRVVIIEANPDRAVARIVPEFRQGLIRKGDRVATKLI